MKKPKFRVGDIVKPRLEVGTGGPRPTMIVERIIEDGGQYICVLNATIRVMDGCKHMRDINWMFEDMLEPVSSKRQSKRVGGGK